MCGLSMRGNAALRCGVGCMRRQRYGCRQEQDEPQQQSEYEHDSVGEQECLTPKRTATFSIESELKHGGASGDGARERPLVTDYTEEICVAPIISRRDTAMCTHCHREASNSENRRVTRSADWRGCGEQPKIAAATSHKMPDCCGTAAAAAIPQASVNA